MLKLLSTLLFLTLSLCAMAQTSLNQRVLFAPDSVNIRESQDAQIEIVAEYMHKHPQATVIVAGLVASFIPVDTISSKQDTPDYHLVPYAGDVFGA